MASAHYTVPEGASPPPSLSPDTEVQLRGPSGGSLTAKSKVTGNQAEGLLGSGARPVERPPIRGQGDKQLPDI